MANYYDITLALAGVCQSAKLVQQFALQGEADTQALNISLQSLLQMTPSNTLDVYGGELQFLRLGLQTLIEQLEGQNQDLGRYWISLLALESRLNKKTEAKSQLGQRINYLPNQLAHYEIDSEEMLGILAGIYIDILSPLQRIKVIGVPDFLQQSAIQNRIRATLLAGVRSAVLWRQVGGSKWQILFFRRKILATAKQIYQSIQ